MIGGAIDARFLPSILKGVMEKMQNGPLTGCYVRDVRVSVLDGKMHPVDSNDISFKIAGLQAFRQAFMDAAPQLLEPVYLLTEKSTSSDGVRQYSRTSISCPLLSMLTFVDMLPCLRRQVGQEDELLHDRCRGRGLQGFDPAP